MAETFDFVTTDAAQIYTAIIGTLMDEVGRTALPGRRAPDLRRGAGGGPGRPLQ